MNLEQLNTLLIHQTKFKQRYITSTITHVASMVLIGMTITMLLPTELQQLPEVQSAILWLMLYITTGLNCIDKKNEQQRGHFKNTNTLMDNAITSISYWVQLTVAICLVLPAYINSLNQQYTYSTIFSCILLCVLTAVLIALLQTLLNNIYISVIQEYKLIFCLYTILTIPLSIWTTQQLSQILITNSHYIYLDYKMYLMYALSSMFIVVLILIINKLYLKK